MREKMSGGAVKISEEELEFIVALKDKESFTIEEVYNSSFAGRTGVFALRKVHTLVQKGVIEAVYFPTGAVYRVAEKFRKVKGFLPKRQ